LMASKAGGQPLFFNEPQSFTQSIEHGDRSRMVVRPGAFGPVVRDQGHIQVPTLAGGTPRSDGGQRTFAEGEGRQPGRTTQTFLRAAIADIDVPTIDLDGCASQRGHGIDDEECVMVPAQAGDRLKWLPGAGRSFGMDDGDGFDWAGSAQCRFDGLWFNDLSPGCFNPDGFAPAAFNNCSEACAEHAIDSNNDRIARLDDIHNRSLHTG